MAYSHCVRAALLSALIMPLAHSAGDCGQAEHSIGGVSIGATEAQVISVFGEPVSRPKLTEAEQMYDTKFAYTDATAYFADGKLQYLESYRTKMCTPSKICPGTPTASVRRILGRNATESSPPGDSLYCFSTESACSIVVVLHTGKAKGLRLECLPSLHGT